MKLANSWDLEWTTLLKIFESFWHKLGTLNLIYMYGIKFNYYLIKHRFCNAFNSILYINVPSHLYIKFNASVYAWKYTYHKLQQYFKSLLFIFINTYV